MNKGNLKKVLCIKKYFFVKKLILAVSEEPKDKRTIKHFMV